MTGKADIPDGKNSGSMRSLGLAMSIPLMLGVGPVLGWFVGVWLDKLAHTGFLRFIFLVLGFIAGVRSVMRTIREDLAVPAPSGAIPGAASARVAPGANVSSSFAAADAVYEDGHLIGTLSYKRAAGSPFAPCPGLGAAPGDSVQPPGEATASPEAESSADADNQGSNEGASEHKEGASLFTLPGIIASGLTMTGTLAAVTCFVWSREVGLGLLATGLWNLCNFAVLWLAFKLLFSGNRMWLFFTIPVISIKIPLLYFLVCELFALHLFDYLGMVLGLLVLPVVFLYLALVQGKS